jgi:hypothetical protein
VFTIRLAPSPTGRPGVTPPPPPSAQAPVAREPQDGRYCLGACAGLSVVAGAGMLAGDHGSGPLSSVACLNRARAPPPSPPDLQPFRESRDTDDAEGSIRARGCYSGSAFGVR